MASYNKVLLMGNLTRDPEVRYTPKGTAVATLGLAVNRVYTTDAGEQKEEVTFVDIEVWGRQAETAGEYLSKGRPVFVEGRLKLDSWDDKETGQKRSKLKVVGERVQFLGAPRQGAEFKDSAPAKDQPRRTGRGQPAAPPPDVGGAAAPAEAAPAEPPADSGDDNIPF
jgi:single-strand DNA-binding protein